MSDNNSEIGKILEKRQESIQKASKTIAYIDRLTEILKALQKTSQELIKHPSAKEEGQTQKVLNDLDFDSLMIRLEEERRIWANLEKRFSRKTINIGVIGRQRMGKSTFLKSVTNLTEEEIPTGDQFSCTSAQSVIYHSEDNAKMSEVHYYNESEFIDQVIKPYYEKLSKEREFDSVFTGQIPNSLKSVGSLTLFKPDKNKKNVVAVGWYDRFYSICKNIKDYQEEVRRGEMVSIGREEIKNYVKYIKDEKDQILSYRFAGVKKVLIYCKFEDHNIHKLGLIDLPGLGDTGLGDEERLIRALGEDVDLVTFVKRPPEGNATWENEYTELYQTAKDILAEKLPIKEWSFMIINKDQVNEVQCEGLKKLISAKPEIEFAQEPIIANLSTKDGARQVLNIAINYLLSNIENLDNQIITNSQRELSRLNQEVLGLLRKASKLSSNSSIERLYDNKSKDFIFDLRNHSFSLREKLKQEGETSNQEFVSQITGIVKKVKEDVKFLTEKEYKRQGIGNLNYYNAYCQSIHDVRSHVLRKFHDFTDKQQDKINERKVEASTLLSNLLGGLQQQSNANGLEFLHYIREQLEGDSQFDGSGIREGFDFICRFKISYDSSMQEVVYSNLLQFFPDTIPGPGSGGDLTEFYNKASAVYALEFPSKGDTSPTQLLFTELNTKAHDLIDGCIAAMGLFVNTELVANVYAIAKSISRILASGSNEEQKKSALSDEIRKLKNSVDDKKGQSNSSSYRLEDLQKAMYFALDVCQEELIQSFGNSTYKISTSMTYEFLDHIAYTFKSEEEWKEFLRTRRGVVWKDFEKDDLLNKKIAEWNYAVDQAKDEVEEYTALFSK